eukprot:g1334.t1
MIEVEHATTLNFIEEEQNQSRLKKAVNQCRDETFLLKEHRKLKPLRKAPTTPITTASGIKVSLQSVNIKNVKLCVEDENRTEKDINVARHETKTLFDSKSVLSPRVERRIERVEEKGMSFDNVLNIKTEDSGKGKVKGISFDKVLNIETKDSGKGKVKGLNFDKVLNIETKDSGKGKVKGLSFDKVLNIETKDSGKGKVKGINFDNVLNIETKDSGKGKEFHTSSTAFKKLETKERGKEKTFHEILDQVENSDGKGEDDLHDIFAVCKSTLEVNEGDIEAKEICFRMMVNLKLQLALLYLTEGNRVTAKKEIKTAIFHLQKVKSLDIDQRGKIYLERLKKIQI